MDIMFNHDFNLLQIKNSLLIALRRKIFLPLKEESCFDISLFVYGVKANWVEEIPVDENGEDGNGDFIEPEDRGRREDDAQFISVFCSQFTARNNPFLGTFFSAVILRLPLLDARFYGASDYPENRFILRYIPTFSQLQDCPSKKKFHVFLGLSKGLRKDVSESVKLILMAIIALSGTCPDIPMPFEKVKNHSEENEHCKVFSL